jgi:hypothetical protein
VTTLNQRVDPGAAQLSTIRTIFTLAVLLAACRSPAPSTSVQTQALSTPTLTAALVVGTLPASPADLALQANLQDLGYQVTLIDDDASATTDATGKSVIVVSESSQSSKIASKYRNVTIPVVALEVAIWDDMSMTGANWQTDFGDAPNVANINVTDPSHPLAAQTPTGNTIIASGTSKLVWGKPANSAHIAAALPNDPTKATVFGYETAAPMVGGFIAPARRVALFAGDPTAATFTAQGAAIFKSAVTWAMRNKELLFVVGNTKLSAGDQSLYQHATRLGFGVHIQNGADVQPANAAGNALVMISETTISATVDTRLRNITQPVLCLEPALFDEFGMTGPTWLSNYGDVAAQTNIQVLATNHPLAAGLTGNVQVSTQPTKFVWGTPSASAVKIATITTQNPLSQTPADEAFAVFGYPAGANMFGLQAPGRRVGWFAGDAAALTFTEIGWRLFDAAVLWSTDAKGPCEGRPNGFACNDGNACTTADACSNGVCTPGNPATCNDQNPCTQDSCNTVLGCQYAPILANESCNNGNLICSPIGNEPPANATTVFREGFEDCKDAWVDGSGQEKPGSQYAQDPVCVNGRFDIRSKIQIGVV